jgi:PAS domain S-box-containing protein
MLGYEDNEMENNLSSWDKKIHPDDRDKTYMDLNNYIEGKTNIYENEHRLLCKNCEYKWGIDRGIIVKTDKDGRPARMIGTHTDINEKKKAEQKINDREEQFRLLFENMNDGFALQEIVFDENRRPFDLKIYYCK